MDLPDISLCFVEYFFVFLPYSSLNLRQKLPFPYLMIIFLCLLGTENQCEADTDGKGIAGKDKPAGGQSPTVSVSFPTCCGWV